jgi:glycosyltransferase involved in cell wall biosynthesis
VKVALVHDWLTGMRGGEKVLAAICGLYPDADIFTLMHDRGSVSPAIERHRIRTSFVQWLPWARTHYRHYLPLFPIAIEQFDLDGYGLVISTSHCAAKAVVPAGRARHLSYCFSPMRYAWDQFDAYFGPARVGPLASRYVYRPILAGMARWDAATAPRVHRFLADSSHVAGRIRRYYNRDSTIVYPPVDTAFYTPGATGPNQPPNQHCLIVSALVPYKRIDLAIDACRISGRALRIVGSGPDRDALERRAGGADVTFLGHQPDEAIREEYRNAAVVILPGEEDFGIVPVEAQACGTPVVAYGRGGACETVRDGETGVLFAEPTASSLAEALERAAGIHFDRAGIRAWSERFSYERHVAGVTAAIAETLAQPAGTRW